MAEIIAPIVNFLVVVFVLWYYGRKPISDYLATRSANIAQQIAEGEKQFSEAEKKLVHWESSWKGAKGLAEEQMSDAKVTATKLREKTLAAAAAESERIAKDAKIVSASEAVRARKTSAASWPKKASRWRPSISAPI